MYVRMHVCMYACMDVMDVYNGYNLCNVCNVMVEEDDQEGKDQVAVLDLAWEGVSDDAPVRLRMSWRLRRRSGKSPDRDAVVEFPLDN